MKQSLSFLFFFSFLVSYLAESSRTLQSRKRRVSTQLESALGNRPPAQNVPYIERIDSTGDSNGFQNYGHYTNGHFPPSEPVYYARPSISEPQFSYGVSPLAPPSYTISKPSPENIQRRARFAMALKVFDSYLQFFSTKQLFIFWGGGFTCFLRFLQSCIVVESFHKFGMVSWKIWFWMKILEFSQQLKFMK